MLELKHIAKTYKTAKGVKTEALKDINLRFPQRGMVFVLGKSGSGKSTLLNIIGGLDRYDQGDLIINGSGGCRGNHHQWEKLCGFQAIGL